MHDILIDSQRPSRAVASIIRMLADAPGRTFRLCGSEVTDRLRQLLAQKEIEEIQMGHPVLPASDESRIGARPLLIRGKRDLIVDKAALLFQIAQDFRSRHGFDWALCR